MFFRLQRYRWFILILVALIVAPSIIHFQATSHPAEAALHTYPATPNLAVPDDVGDACDTVSGPPATHTIIVPDNYTITDINVQINITTRTQGDVAVYLTHGATTITLLDRPGTVPFANCLGYGGDDIIAVLDDEGDSGPIENAYQPRGQSYTPEQALTAFDGQNVNGAWTLTLRDFAETDIATLVSWDLVVDDGFTPLAASAACNLDNLNVTITAGDTPFNITGTGPGLPLNGMTAGTHPLVGPGNWTGVTVTEVGGNQQTTNLGNFNCATIPLAASAVCNLDNLNVTITAGDTPFNITGTGPGLPLNNVTVGTYPLTGPGSWTGVTVTEVGGNQQATNLGNFNCATNGLTASAVCNLDNLNVTITAGDTPFNITGTGPGLPLNNVTAGTFPLVGPGNWTGVTVTEVGGNQQATNLGNFNCATNLLTASAICQADNLVVTITAGDTPFNLTGTGAGLPQNGVTAGSYTLTGPGSWTGVTVTEVGGNQQVTNLGNFNCVTTGLNVVAQCIADNLWVTILNGDALFNITGTGPGLPLNNIAASTFSLTGPSAWTGVTVTELSGNQQTFVAGNFACQGVGIPVPNRGLIKIDLGQAQFALQKPNGDPLALTNGTPILLPADADHNGYDTYIVTGVVYVEGEYWLSIFLGNTTWGWVPLDLVTPLTYFELPPTE